MASQGQIRTGWLGWVAFAGIAMIVIGIAHVLYGIAAFARSGTYLTQFGTAFTVDFAGVGWTYLVLGLIIAVAGAGVMSGRTWARTIGIVLAALSVLANVVFFSAYPLWSALVIVLGLVVIYALAVHGREARPMPR